MEVREDELPLTSAIIETREIKLMKRITEITIKDGSKKK